MILKKGWFSDLAILKIYGQINSEEYEQDSLTQIEKLNTEKKKSSNRTETQILLNRKTTNISTTK